MIFVKQNIIKSTINELVEIECFHELITDKPLLHELFIVLRKLVLYENCKMISSAINVPIVY